MNGAQNTVHRVYLYINIVAPAPVELFSLHIWRIFDHIIWVFGFLRFCYDVICFSETVFRKGCSDNKQLNYFTYILYHLILRSELWIICSFCPLISFCGEELMGMN